MKNNLIAKLTVQLLLFSSISEAQATNSSESFSVRSLYKNLMGYENNNIMEKTKVGHKKKNRK